MLHDYEAVTGRLLYIGFAPGKDLWCAALLLEQADPNHPFECKLVFRDCGDSPFRLTVNGYDVTFAELLPGLLEYSYDVTVMVPVQPSYLHCHEAHFTTVADGG
jgi:hypothetical protein